MKKYITKQPVLNLIIGIVLLAASILLVVYQTEVTTILEYLIAGVIIVYALLFFRRNIMFYKNQTARVLVSSELLLAVFFAVLLVSFDNFTTTMAIGLILYVKGAVFLLIHVYLKKSLTVELYFVKLVLITLGTFLFFTDMTVEIILIYALAVLFLLYALVFISYAIMQFKENKPKAKPTAVSDQIVPEPKKPDVFTKKALMDKHVDELRNMCKERNIKGYSNMRKETLVEKLWLYEHDQT